MTNPIGRIKVTKKGKTEIMHSESGTLMFRLDAELNVFDVEMLRQLAGMAYRAGITDGEHKLQSELKELLGIGNDE
ncbi:hypothetical protein AH332_20155 [Salmonella enterica subsp. salamae]|nr:hypothetical protein [Salmonella enterica subsp. salamae]EDW4022404.1 hypothetical protein [Salmonella enterica subsp. salamae]EEJ9248182.1 hypothetical protein [Salmonella enterica subsp. enterica serovar Muenchen]EEP0995053.1 hypothetical protein [Salmonella enterica]